MPTIRPRITVTRELSDGVMARMRDLFDTRIHLEEAGMSRAALEAAVAECDVLVPTITDTIDASLIEHAGPRLKLIANFGAGIDHIDLAAARARNIHVTNTPGVLTEDTADMTMALVLAVARRLREGENMVRSGSWSGWRPGGMLGHRVNGKTLCIIGMGRIGRAVAQRARGFSMRVRYHNRHQLPSEVESEIGATYEPNLDALLADADVISVNCPHTPATHHLLNAERLALLGPNTCVINTARGEIIDEEALIDALVQRRIAGAGLDVYANEPHVDKRLIALDNVVLLPHMGSATYEGRTAMGEKVIANIRAWVDGHRPPDLVLEGWI